MNKQLTYPILLSMIGGGLLVGALISFFSVSIPGKKDFKALEKKAELREKAYIKSIDSLNKVTDILYEAVEEIDDSIIVINEIRDETLDSIINMPTDSILKFLTDRFNINY